MIIFARAGNGVYMYATTCTFFTMQKGVDVIVDGIQHKFKGTVMLVPGDNLASQCLGGYKSLASALRKCRHCMAVNEDMQTKVSMYIVHVHIRSCTCMNDASSRPCKINRVFGGVTYS